jgi:hypothetical protein
MRTPTRIIAAMQLVLIVPAALFMTAVLAGRIWTLWLLLLALPCAVLIAGCATLLAAWNHDIEVPHSARQSLVTIQAPLATLGVAGTTLASAGILAIVVLHMLAH